jgi:hypothetical protein
MTPARIAVRGGSAEDFGDELRHEPWMLARHLCEDRRERWVLPTFVVEALREPLQHRHSTGPFDRVGMGWSSWG